MPRSEPQTIETMLQVCFRLLVVIAIASITAAAVLILVATAAGSESTL